MRTRDAWPLACAPRAWRRWRRRPRRRGGAALDQDARAPVRSRQDPMTSGGGSALRARHRSGRLWTVPVPPESFGAVLRRLRERSGLTQESLAERAGLSPRAIRALERGERQHPYPHTLRAIAEALGLSSEDLEKLQMNVPQRVPAGRSGDPDSILEQKAPQPSGVAAVAPVGPPGSTAHRPLLPARRPTLGRDDEVTEVVGNLIAT